MNETLSIEYPSYLAHHGILGMKWGVRRYQNEDGSYTEAGKKRYGHEIEARNFMKQKQEEYKNAKGFTERLKAKGRVDTAKKAIKYAKEKDALYNETGEKSKQRLKYEEEYKKKGYSDEDAAIAARNKERTKKALMIAGGVALTAAVAYGAYKYQDYALDKVINTDTKLYRFAQSKGGVHDNFYVTPDLKDARKYVGLYGGGQLGGTGGNQKVIKLKQSVKIASEKHARQVLNGLISDDPSFKKSIIDRMDQQAKAFRMAGLGDSPQGRLYTRAAKDLRSGKVTRKVYDAFNADIVDRSTGNGQKLIDALREKGYGAVVDINDKRYSGYDTKRPWIIFDASNANIESMRSIGAEEFKKEYARGVNGLLMKEVRKLGLYAGGATAAVVGADVGSKRAAERAQIRKYKQDHPNTKMNDAEILDAIYNQPLVK